ncbi:hypothetical protein [Mycolicibacter minnesotensis]|nr:MAG: hypothetical protein E6R06_03965 [Mycobacterium sp.]
MPALATFPVAASTDIDGESFVQEFVRGEFYDDTYGLVTAPPPLGVAAALAAVTVMAGALALFVMSNLAGMYAARHRQGV